MSSVMWDGSELAERYDRISDIQYKSGRLLVEKMHVKKGDRVLDVGCGTGRLALYVADIFRLSGLIIGIDPSPHRIKVAEAKLEGKERPNIRFVMGKGEDLSDFGNDSFDHVYYSSVFHWIDDKKAAVEEAFRVLRPGGNVGLTTVDKSHPFAMRKVMEEIFLKEPYSGKVSFQGEMGLLVDRDEIVKLMENAGFVRISIDYVPETHHYASAEELFGFIEASSFGNFLRDIPDEFRPRALEDMKRALETMRKGNDIVFESNTLFAIAYKPGGQ